MASFKIESLRIDKLVSMLVALAFVFATLLVATQPANATDGGALFRVKQRWWYSQAESWTSGNVQPDDDIETGPGMPGIYKPPGTLRVGYDSKYPNNPPFTMPKSIIKNTTYKWKCGKYATATFMCYIGYPASSWTYSYYNGKGSFGPNWNEAPASTTTVRVRTTMDNFNPTKASEISQTGYGWPEAPHEFAKGKPKERNINLPYTGAGPYTTGSPIPAGKLAVPTAMFSRITPTLGGCPNRTNATPTVNGAAYEPGHNGTIYTMDTRPITALTQPDGNYLQCPGTTQFDGLYSRNRAGSIMIFPGNNRFGGTMRGLSGPNAFGYQKVTADGPITTVQWPALPISLQTPTTVPRVIGEILISPVGAFRYRQTGAGNTKLIHGFTANGATCPQGTGTMTRPPAFEPNHDGDCAYYRRDVKYMGTGGPYTTGKIRNWQPFGNTNTLQTTTGYDNRTALGLNGIISLVQPGLSHAYLQFPSSSDPIKPILMSWGSARLYKIDFRMMPEPTGAAMLAAGFVTLAGLYRLRRR